MQRSSLNSFLLGFALTSTVLGLASWRFLSNGKFYAVVAADNMNVLYYGIDNPIRVTSTEGLIDSTEISTDNGQISGEGSMLNFQPNHIGACTITVKKNGKVQVFPFRVKKIPDPVPVLGTWPNRNYFNREFKTQRGIAAILENFDFDAKCSITSFTLVRTSPSSDPVEVNNIGGTYTPDAQALVNLAIPGDTYYFTNIKCHCPGDTVSRLLGSFHHKVR